MTGRSRTTKNGPATASNASTTAPDIVVERTIDAPRDVVFRAWSDPRQLKKWWSPRGWTTPHVTVDFRVGGVFHYAMKPPDGEAIWGRGGYREIDPPRRIVYSDSFSDPEGRVTERDDYPRESLVTVTFTERDGKTVVTVRHSGLYKDVGEGAGWKEMLDRLEGHLGAARRP